MDVSEIIESALSSVCTIVRKNKYEGPASEYIIYQYIDERPAGNADNIDIIEEVTIRINFYTQQEDYQGQKKAIKKALRNAEFTLISIGEEYDKDTKFTRLYIDFWIAGDSDVEA